MADGSTTPRRHHLAGLVRRFQACRRHSQAASHPRVARCRDRASAAKREKKVPARRGPLLFAFTSHLSSVELRMRRVVV